MISRKAKIIRVTQSQNNSDIINQLFVLIRQYENGVLEEDGNITCKDVLLVYPLVNGRIVPNILSFIVDEVEYDIIRECSYTMIPTILTVYEPENKS